MSESVPMRLVHDLWSCEEKRQPGDAEYYAYQGQERAGLIFVCPRCKQAGSIAFHEPARWTWDGNIERPTCTPSILHSAKDCGWHGYLTDGVFVGL